MTPAPRCPICNAPIDTHTSAKCAAATLRLSPRTVRRLLAAGRLTAPRIGRERRVCPNSMQRYVDDDAEDAA